MTPFDGPHKKTYKIRLASGRILGPLELYKVGLLISRNQITGIEIGREYPKGEWKNINLISEIADLLAAHASGGIDQTLADKSAQDGHGFAREEDAASVDPLAPTAVFVSREVPDEIKDEIKNESKDEDRTESPDAQESSQVGDESDSPDSEELRGKSADEKSITESRQEATVIGIPRVREDSLSNQSSIDSSNFQEIEVVRPSSGNEVAHSIARERTVMFQRPSAPKEADKSDKGKNGGGGLFDLIKIMVLALGIGYLGFDYFLSEPEAPIASRADIVRPKLPAFNQEKPNPNASVEAYNEAMKYYLADTVVGYKKAAQKLREAATLDRGNVKALAMLASSYLNLIDSSNKDADYFSVISKLIDLSRAKSVDLSEAVIADVEFFIVVNKAEAAQSRIVEYTKKNQSFGTEMFFYLALSFYTRADYAMAARYLSQFTEGKVFSAKVYYLKGQVAESFKDLDAAMKEYRRAVEMNPEHAKSHLKIAELLQKQGNLKEAGKHLDFLTSHTSYLSPMDLGKAYYLHAQFSILNQKRSIALGDMERACRLDPENHDYLLELYTLRARQGESLESAKKQARMYYFLGEGERAVKQGKHQNALVFFLQARQANEESVLPLIKIGDMFTYLHDIDNAKRNYKKAAESSPNNIQIWSKYVQALIQSYEWEEAQKAMDRFRKLDVGQSAIDKAAADLYQNQGRPKEAQVLYKKAMAREVIDPDVYIAYGKSLMSTRNFKDAPFFFALALRYDPLNVDAIINTAKCIAETESIEQAIRALQDELKREGRGKAEFFAAIAELFLQKGDWQQAQSYVDQAKAANPDYGYPWTLQAKIYLNKEGVDKDATEKALSAYKSSSDRNKSDPAPYLGRFSIFVKRTQYEEANLELVRIFEIYPKFPKYHFYKGRLYAIQGNHRVAAEELKAELANNPNNAETLIEYGKELLELGYFEDGLKKLTLGMQLAPGSADAKQSAGWANYKLKHFQAAVALIQAALAIDRGNPTIYRRLGIVYRDSGDIASACGAFRKYLEMEPDAPDKAAFAACL